jgi:hypothetical protein
MGRIKQAIEFIERCLSMPLFKHPIASHLTEEARVRLRQIRQRE